MKKLFVTTSALVAVIPGVGILGTGVAAPPAHEVWYGAAVEVVSVATFLLFLMFKTRIVKWLPTRASLAAIALGVLAAITLTAYFVLYQWCVVSVSSRGTVFYPLWTTDKLAESVERQGGRAAALEHYGLGWIQGLIEETPLLNIVVTEVALLGTMLIGAMCLVAMFLILGMHVQHVTLSSHTPKPVPSDDKLSDGGTNSTATNSSENERDTRNG